MMSLDGVQIGLLQGHWQGPLIRLVFGIWMCRKMLFQEKSLISALSVFVASVVEGPLGFLVFASLWFFARKPFELYSMLGALFAALSWMSPAPIGPWVGVVSAYFLGLSRTPVHYFTYPLLVSWFGLDFGSYSIEKVLALSVVAAITEELFARSRSESHVMCSSLPIVFHVLLGIAILSPDFNVSDLSPAYFVALALPIILWVLGCLEKKTNLLKQFHPKVPTLSVTRVQWMARSSGFWRLSHEWVFLVLLLVICASALFLWTAIGGGV